MVAGLPLWTLALLVFVLVIPLLALFAVGLGLIELDWSTGEVAIIILVIALAVFSSILVWGSERLGYIAALVTGALVVLGIGRNIAIILRGDRPRGLLVTNVPGVVFALALVVAFVLGLVG